MSVYTAFLLLFWCGAQKIVSPGHTVNKECYWTIMRRLRKTNRLKRPKL